MNCCQLNSKHSPILILFFFLSTFVFISNGNERRYFSFDSLQYFFLYFGSKGKTWITFYIEVVWKCFSQGNRKERTYRMGCRTFQLWKWYEFMIFEWMDTLPDFSTMATISITEPANNSSKLSTLLYSFHSILSFFEF